MSRARILVADDHRMVAEGLRIALSGLEVHPVTLPRALPWACMFGPLRGKEKRAQAEKWRCPISEPVWLAVGRGFAVLTKCHVPKGSSQV